MPCLKIENIMTACDFCNIDWCGYEVHKLDKNACFRVRCFEQGKRKANERALALYERKLRQFKRVLNEVSSDKTAGELISVSGSLAAFKKALEK